MADRVAIVAFCWFVLWTGVGVAVGSVVGAPTTGAINGFFFALLALSVWPWIMPEPIEIWMDDYYAQRSRCRSTFNDRWRLVINLTTAKALGITVPLQLLGRADEVIE